MQNAPRGCAVPCVTPSRSTDRTPRPTDTTPRPPFGAAAARGAARMVVPMAECARERAGGSALAGNFQCSSDSMNPSANSARGDAPPWSSGGPGARAEAACAAPKQLASLRPKERGEEQGAGRNSGRGGRRDRHKVESCRAPVAHLRVRAIGYSGGTGSAACDEALDGRGFDLAADVPQPAKAVRRRKLAAHLQASIVRGAFLTPPRPLIPSIVVSVAALLPRPCPSSHAATALGVATGTAVCLRKVAGRAASTARLRLLEQRRITGRRHPCPLRRPGGARAAWPATAGIGMRAGTIELESQLE